jgi:hypothetical protein
MKVKRSGEESEAVADATNEEEESKKSEVK